MRGPYAVGTERGTHFLHSSWVSQAESVPLPPAAGFSDGGGAWPVPFKPQLQLNSFTRRTLAAPTGRSRSAEVEVRAEVRRGAAARASQRERRSSLARFSVRSAVWLRLREHLQLPTCPERPRKCPDLSKPRWPKLLWVTARPSPPQPRTEPL